MSFLKKFKFYSSFIWGAITLPCFIRRMRKLKRDDEVVVCLLPTFGDTVYAMLFLEQFKKENNKKICVYCAAESKFFVEKYTFIDRIVTYKRNSLEDVRVRIFPFMRFMKKDKRNKDGVYPIAPSSLEFKGLSALEAYRDEIFRVKKDVRNYYPSVEAEIKSIPNFEEIKDKIVVINPYSSTHRNKMKVYERIAKELKEDGYIVYSNVVTRLNQKPIPNTLPLDVGIFELRSIVNEIPLFISTRSGIMDFLVSGTGNLFAIYFINIRHFFTLKDVRSEKIFEFRWVNKKSTERLITNIKMFLNKIEEEKHKK